MAVQLTFNFDTEQGAVEFLTRKLPSAEPEQPGPSAPVEPAAAKKRGRPKRVAEAIPQAPVSPGMDEALGKTAVHSIEDVRAALARLNEAKGIATAKGVLAKFGAARISEVKAEDYSAFVADCDSAAA